MRNYRKTKTLFFDPFEAGMHNQREKRKTARGLTVKQDGNFNKFDEMIEQWEELKSKLADRINPELPSDLTTKNPKRLIDVIKQSSEVSALDSSKEKPGRILFIRKKTSNLSKTQRTNDELLSKVKLFKDELLCSPPKRTDLVSKTVKTRS